MEKKHPYYGKSIIIDFPDFPHTTGFVAFSCTLGNLWGNPCISHMLKYTKGWESDGEKKHPYYGKSLSINFPDVPHTVGFVAFSRKCKCKGNPYISHMLKYTIGWESGWKKAPILWENYDCRFPRLSSYHGFCCICPYCGKFMGKPMYFRYVDIG